MHNISQKIIKTIEAGGKVLVCGNGGSACESDHLVGELVGKFLKDRRALPAISLTCNTVVLTAIANDYGYEKVFVRQLEALGKTGDVLIALSTSGKSKNILAAIKWANKEGLYVIDLERKGKDTATIQENHLKMLHKITELIEEAFI